MSFRTAAAFILTFALLFTPRTSDAATLGLAWDPATDGVTTGYIVWYGTSPGSYTQSIDVGMTTTYTVNNLADGTTYYFAVQGYNATRQVGPHSSEVAGTTRPGGAPSNLIAAIREGRYIDLSWQAPSGTVSGYRIEVGTAAGQSNVTTITTGTATTYTISNLAAGTYYIRVRAVNSTGTSGPSNEVTATLVSSPSTPTNLAATVRSGQYIDLSWQAPSGTVSGYRIEVGTAAGQSNAITISTGTATTYTISTLTAGTYYIRVRAVNSTGTSGPSNEVTATLGSSPTPPTNLTATVRRKHYVDLTWRPPSTGASSYRIDVGTAPGQSDVRSVTTTATRFTISDLRAGRYYFRAHSVSGTDVSGPSNEASVQVVRGGRPLPPDNLAAAVRDNRTIDLTWEADDEALYYRVEVGTQPGQTDVSSFTTGVTTSFTIGELPTNTYYIRVRAANDEGIGDPTVDVVVGGIGGDNAPRRLSATVGADRTVRLIWDPPQDPSGVTGYLIEAGTSSGRTDLGTIPTNELALTTAPVPEGTYFVRVRSVTATGPGSASNEVVAYIGSEQQCSAPPAAPRFVASVVGSLVQLSWSPGVGDTPTGYVLDVGTAPGRRDILSMPLAAHITTVTARAADGTYSLRLTAVNACGASTWGSDTSITLGTSEVGLPGAPSSLTQQVNGRAVTLAWAPPTVGGEPTSYRIEVLTPGGLLLLALDTGNLATTFTHGNAPPGQYVVRVRAANARGMGAPSNTVTVQIP